MSGKSDRITCPRCGRKDLCPDRRITPRRVPSHVRPASQQRNAWHEEVRILCR